VGLHPVGIQDENLTMLLRTLSRALAELSVNNFHCIPYTVKVEATAPPQCTAPAADQQMGGVSKSSPVHHQAVVQHAAHVVPQSRIAQSLIDTC